MGNKPADFSLNIFIKNGQKDTAWERMNSLGKAGTPFLFLTDFSGQQIETYTFEELEDSNILFDIQGFTNIDKTPFLPKKWYFEKQSISYDQYLKGFKLVQKNIRAGETFLLNYTCATPVRTNLSLPQIFHLSSAKYKLLCPGRFTFFSPETFVKIKNGLIRTYPMKGTIDASLPNAREQILADKKEIAEHNTIVDLLRNDLSRVAKKVRVKRFRYVEKIPTNGKHLLQVSSEITGQLPDGWQGQIGNIFKKLLPAGSVSGAPKKKTIEIIRQAEGQERGFYTGIVGLFDGQQLDSGVAIRFIEKTKNEMQFRSGGGITCFSDPASEYQEMVDKVYLTTQNKPAPKCS